MDRQIGSFALGLRRIGFSGQIVGVADKATINACWKLGMISDGSEHLPEMLPGANLIMLSSVASHVEGMLPKVLEHVDEGAVISEMTRVKGDINRVIGDSGRADLHYVGFRLLGEDAVAGDYTKADRFFFEGKTVILTPRDKRDLEAFSHLQDLIRKMGATVVAMSPQAHDRLLAQIHHVPKAAVLAVLQRLFSESDHIAFTPELLGDWLAGETRDIVQSREMGWVEEIEANQELVLEGIDEFISRLQAIKNNIINGKLSAEVDTLIEKAPESLKAEVSVEGFDVVLAAGPDPKNLERVSELLAKARIKIGNLSRMEHAEPGTYRLALHSSEDNEAAVRLLRGAGFEVVNLSE
ncbi:prephenate dehydrogenase/arogenate dehydrogenase family protein [bacterium]|nr:prephenate dehydrogenase/arogenate dehydrogenase family protein [bacterium]MBU1983414.1 prephenate dehydrogenase/arogenate dehydrogenase family protein [bacterium]